MGEHERRARETIARWDRMAGTLEPELRERLGGGLSDAAKNAIISRAQARDTREAAQRTASAATAVAEPSSNGPAQPTPGPEQQSLPARALQFTDEGLLQPIESLMGAGISVLGTGALNLGQQLRFLHGYPQTPEEQIPFSPVLDSTSRPPTSGTSP